MRSRPLLDRRVNGYLLLMNEYLGGALDPWLFRSTVISLWMSDVDAQHSAPSGEPETDDVVTLNALAERLPRVHREGWIDDETFLVNWTELWRMRSGPDQPGTPEWEARDIICKLHSDAYFFTPIEQDIAEDPEFFISNETMRKFDIENHAELMKLLKRFRGTEPQGAPS